VAAEVEPLKLEIPMQLHLVEMDDQFLLLVRRLFTLVGVEEENFPQARQGAMGVEEMGLHPVRELLELQILELVGVEEELLEVREMVEMEGQALSFCVTQTLLQSQSEQDLLDQQQQLVQIK
jgi:hypothetical protein